MEKRTTQIVEVKFNFITVMGGNELSGVVRKLKLSIILQFTISSDLYGNDGNELSTPRVRQV